MENTDFGPVILGLPASETIVEDYTYAYADGNAGAFATAFGHWVAGTYGALLAPFFRTSWSYRGGCIDF